jgi:hypothetical protein
MLLLRRRRKIEKKATCYRIISEKITSHDQKYMTNKRGRDEQPAIKSTTELLISMHAT